jgi:PAS domain-containing protein
MRQDLISAIMPEENEHLEQIIKGVHDQLREVLENSTQSIYIYLDDIHKICNERFSSMLGYSSPEDWASVEENFPDAFVSKNSQKTLVTAYQNSMKHFEGATNTITWKTKSGKEVKTTTILVPIIYEGHSLALHFISPTR